MKILSLLSCMISFSFVLLIGMEHSEEELGERHAQDYASRAVEPFERVYKTTGISPFSYIPDYTLNIVESESRTESTKFYLEIGIDTQGMIDYQLKKIMEDVAKKCAPENVIAIIFNNSKKTFNSLTQLSFKPFNCIRGLSIKKSGLTTLKGIEKLSVLEYINFSNNEITDLEPLVACKRLKTINGCGNQIAVLPDSLDQLTNLSSLDLCHNQIRDIRPLTNLFMQLQILKLCDNPLNLELILTIIPELSRQVAVMRKVADKSFTGSDSQKIINNILNCFRSLDSRNSRILIIA